MERIDVTRADGARMTISAMGEGPRLLCIAGGPGRSAVYLGDLGGLTTTRTLMIADARGTGRSDDAVDPTGWRVAEVAKDLPLAAAAVSAGPVDVLAHSAGSSAALLFAASHPERVNRLVLVTPSARGLPDGTSDADRIRETRRAEPIVAEAIAARERLLAGAEPDEVDQLVALMNPMFYGPWTESAQQHADAETSQVNPTARSEFYSEAFTLDAVAPRLAACTAPVLILTGALDCATGVSTGDHIASLFPTAAHMTLDGCGHFPWVDAPAQFYAAVDGFLQA